MDTTSTTGMIGLEKTIVEFGKRLLRIIDELQNVEGSLESTPRSASNKDVSNKVADGLLHRVVSHGNEWMTRHLIELGANVDTKVNAAIPLQIAIKKQNRELVEILLNAKADNDISNYFSTITALQQILDKLAYPNHCMKKVFMHDIKRKMSTLENFTKKAIEVGFSVYDAALLGNVEVMKYMIEYGFDVNFKGPASTTPLHATVYTNNPEMMKFLLENGADINVLDNDGIDALFYAVNLGRYDMMDMLLQRGANPNAFYDEVPILLWAIVKADYVGRGKNWTRPTEKSCDAVNAGKCIELLLQQGAHLQIRNSRQTIFEKTHALDRKCEETYSEDVKSIGSVSLIIAHLVMLKMLGKQISKGTRAGINVDVRYKKYYQLCRQILKAKIFKSMTLFDLLTESDDEMKIHMRNKNFVFKLLRISRKYELAVVYPYYFNTLENRISRIAKELRLKYFAAKAISDISKYNMSHLITDKIVGYLDQQSLEKFVASAEVHKFLKRCIPVKTI